MLEGPGLTRLLTSWNWILTLGKLCHAGISDVQRVFVLKVGPPRLNLSVLLSGKVVRLRTREGNTVPVSLTVRKLVDTSRVMVLLEPVTR